MDEEVETLLELWSQKNKQQVVTSSIKNRHIFEEFSQGLQTKGFLRSDLQCYKKMKQFQDEYRQFVGTDLSSAPRQLVIFFPKLDEVLSKLDPSGWEDGK